MFTIRHQNGDGTVYSDPYWDGEKPTLDEAISFAVNEVPIKHDGWYAVVFIENEAGQEVWTRKPHQGKRAR